LRGAGLAGNRSQKTVLDDLRRFGFNDATAFWSSLDPKRNPRPHTTAFAHPNRTPAEISALAARLLLRDAD